MVYVYDGRGVPGALGTRRVAVGLTLYNTLSRTLEPFRPITPGVVRMFVCGPTVYDLSHLGHAKTYVQFDFVARYLRFSGYDVTYLQNITDIDDKIIERARVEGESPRAIAERFESAYLADMAALHIDGVDRYARAHDFVDRIVMQVQRLIKRGHAYRLDDGWYFDLSTFPRYGVLSGRAESAGGVSRITENQAKRQAGDFAVWKARKSDEPYWDSPIGAGRPGWHIEDTAITEALFGPRYDLHGGGSDLMFPHHEAEIAQMESISGLAPLARYWMHTGLLRIDGAKMAKSSGSPVTIRDALQRVDFRTLRFAFLSRHYRSSAELTETFIDSARAARRRVESFARSIDPDRHETGRAARMIETARARFVERLDDDLDTPGALAVIFELIRNHHRDGLTPGREARDLLCEVNELFDAFDLGDGRPERSVDEAVERRRRLRAEGRYGEADAIRADLWERGIAIEDTQDGTRWWVRRAPHEAGE